jgi:tetratricopeptide (TPR) repeat protein
MKSPESGSVRHELAEVLALTGRYSEAITEFERASTDQAKLSPINKLESDLRRAEVLKLTGQEDQARAIFESFVAYYNNNQPQSAPELTLIARALAHLERYQDANDVYRTAIEADASYLEAHLGAAELYTEKYNYGDASQFLEDALALNPNSPRAYLDVAQNKILEGGEEVSAALNRALAVNPNLVPALVLKANLALTAGQYSEASPELDKVYKLNPRNLEAHSLRAASQYSLRDHDATPGRRGTVCPPGNCAVAKTLDRASQSRNGVAASGTDGSRSSFGREIF